jgi:hypothetical protein
VLAFSMMQTPRLWPLCHNILAGKYIWTTGRQLGALDGTLSTPLIEKPTRQVQKALQYIHASTVETLSLL